MLGLGVLASHQGTNLQAIIDACKAGQLDAEVRVVISNNKDSGALERSRREGIESIHLSSATHPDPQMLDSAISQSLVEHEVDLVVLAGYMKKVGPTTLAQFKGRILNVHPALLPEFGGAGMFGKHVHEAVLKAGRKETGVSVHLVDEEYDRGRVIAQARVPVRESDTAEALADRVLEVEHKLLVETLSSISSGRLIL